MKGFFPSAKELGNNYAGAWGAEVTAPESSGLIDNGVLALPARVEGAGRLWPEAPAAEFEREGRRRWRHLPTGFLYRRVNGWIQPEVMAYEDADLFILYGGEIVALVADSRPEVRSVPTGQVVAHEVTAIAPMEGPRIT